MCTTHRNKVKEYSRRTSGGMREEGNSRGRTEMPYVHYGTVFHVERRLPLFTFVSVYFFTVPMTVVAKKFSLAREIIRGKPNQPVSAAYLGITFLS